MVKAKEVYVIAAVLLITKLIGKLNMSYLEVFTFVICWTLGAFIYEAAKGYVKYVRGN